jgi:site-specific recombinase XerD
MPAQHFDHYLQQQKLSPKSIAEHLKHLHYFLTWANSQELQQHEQISYAELLDYVHYLKSKSLSIPTINLRLNSLRKYYEHLKEEKHILKNPAKNLHIRGAAKTITEQPLSYSELQDLYTQYQQYSQDKSYHLRNTVLLGLFIYQGIHTGEAEILQTEHIRLSENNIYIPSTKRSNSRILPLEAKQIIPLYQYLDQIAPTATQPLFIGNVKNHSYRLKDELQGINPILCTLQQIRASVFLYWLRLYDKRQVQYRTGHKWISSTERYEQQEITHLSDLLQKHHPFG